MQIYFEHFTECERKIEYGEEVFRPKVVETVFIVENYTPGELYQKLIDAGAFEEEYFPHYIDCTDSDGKSHFERSTHFTLEKLREIIGEENIRK